MSTEKRFRNFCRRSLVVSEFDVEEDGAAFAEQVDLDDWMGFGRWDGFSRLRGS